MYNFLKRFLSLILASDIFKPHAGFLVCDDPRIGLASSTQATEAPAAKVHRRTVVTHGLFELSVKSPAAKPDESDGQDIAEEQIKPYAVVAVVYRCSKLHIMVFQTTCKGVIIGP